jgi:hypothetical protein
MRGYGVGVRTLEVRAYIASGRDLDVLACKGALSVEIGA